MLSLMSTTNRSLLQTIKKTEKSPVRLEAVARGIKNVQRRNRNLQAKCQEFHTEYGRQLGLGALEPFTRAVSEYMAEESKPRSQSDGRPHSFSRYAIGNPPTT